MTEVSDKQKHKPSAKHTLDEVRKSLEDLVRNQFDDTAPTAAEIDVADTDQTVQDQVTGVPVESAPARSRHRRQRSAAEGLDTDQVLESLNDLLGNELGGEAQVDREAGAMPSDVGETGAAEGVSADERAPDQRETQDESAPVTLAEPVTAAEHTSDRVPTESEDRDSALETPPASEADLPPATGIGDIDIDVVELDDASVPKASATTRTVDEAELELSLPEPVVSAAAEPAAHTPPAEGASGGELEAGEDLAIPEPGAPLGDETEEITLEAPALDMAPEPEGVSDTGGDTTEALELEGRVAPPATVDELDLSQSSLEASESAPTAAETHVHADAEAEPIDSGRIDLAESGSPLAPAAPATDAAQPEQPEPPASIERPEIIDTSSPHGIQQGFTFEDPALTAAVHSAETRRVSKQQNEASGHEAARDVTAEPRAEVARKPEHSELVLEEEETDANTALGWSSESEEEVFIDLPASSTADVISADESQVSEGALSDISGADDRPTAHDDDSEPKEHLAETVTSMDALEIPGGEQLSDEMTQPKPPPESDTTKEDVPVKVEPPEITQSPDPQTPASGPEHAASPIADTPSDTSEQARAAEHSRGRARKVLTAVMDDQSESLKMPSIDFSPDAPVADDGASGPTEQAVEPSPSADLPQPPAAGPLAGTGPSITPSTRSQPSESEFVDLGDSISDARDPVGAPPFANEKPVSHPAVFGQHREAAMQGPPSIPWRAEPKRTRGAVTLSPTSAQKRAGMVSPKAFDPGISSDIAAGAPAARAKFPSSTDADPGRIPVLRDVVGPRPFDAPAPEPSKKKPIPPTSEKTLSRPAVDKKAARLKSKPRKALRGGARRHARTRDLAVQVVAKLNMELRKCGERALSPAIIDRLQFLLREALEQQRANVDNSQHKK